MAFCLPCMKKLFRDSQSSHVMRRHKQTNEKCLPLSFIRQHDTCYCLAPPHRQNLTQLRVWFIKEVIHCTHFLATIITAAQQRNFPGTKMLINLVFLASFFFIVSTVSSSSLDFFFALFSPVRDSKKFFLAKLKRGQRNIIESRLEHDPNDLEHTIDLNFSSRPSPSTKLFSPSWLQGAIQGGDEQHEKARGKAKKFMENASLHKWARRAS